MICNCGPTLSTLKTKTGVEHSKWAKWSCSCQLLSLQLSLRRVKLPHFSGSYLIYGFPQWGTQRLIFQRLFRLLLAEPDGGEKRQSICHLYSVFTEMHSCCTPPVSSSLWGKKGPASGTTHMKFLRNIRNYQSESAGRIISTNPTKVNAYCKPFRRCHDNS